jgi:hypothetical protein
MKFTVLANHNKTPLGRGWARKGMDYIIGATTENPSFEVILALLSRCQVRLKRFGKRGFRIIAINA